MSIIADWERQEFNKYDRRCCAEDAYNEAIEREIESIKEDIANGYDDAICALGTDYEEMRIKILTAIAEDRLEQLEEDYRKGFILND